ncbi:MAG: TIGR03086 family metal-binding protein, partial [Acidimicrobiia bacterium]
MELLPALEATFDHAHRVIAGIGPEQVHASTPCRDWDLEQLVGHTVSVVANIGRALGGPAGDDAPEDDAGFRLTTDAGERFRQLADATLAAWRTADLSATVDIGAGPMPAETALAINLLDTGTHSWDIARATGQDETMPDGLAEYILSLVDGFITDDIRSFAGFDPAVPID